MRKVKVLLHDMECEVGATQLGRALRTEPNAGLFIGEFLCAYANGGPSPKQAGSMIAAGIEVDHRTLQQKTISVLLHTLYAIGTINPKSGCDARNEASYEACRKFREQVDLEEIPMDFPLI